MAVVQPSKCMLSCCQGGSHLGLSITFWSVWLGGCPHMVQLVA